MTDFEIAGLVIFMIGALPSYLLAEFIQRRRKYSLFAGWDPSKIKDEEAYAKTLCNGLRGFALVMALGCALLYFNVIGIVLFAAFVVVFPAVPLVHYILKAKRHYGK